MPEMEANQSVAREICSTLRWNGQEFHYGEAIALLDGKVVTVAKDLTAAVRALRAIEPNPGRGMVFDVAPLLTEAIR